MAAGVAHHVWRIDEIVDCWDRDTPHLEGRFKDVREVLHGLGEMVGVDPLVHPLHALALYIPRLLSLAPR